MTKISTPTIKHPRVVKQVIREKTAKALVLIAELSKTKNPGEQFDATDIHNCIQTAYASKLLFSALVENGFLEKVANRKYLILLERIHINTEMAVRLVRHYNKKATNYHIESNNKKSGLKQKTDKYIVIPKIEYLNYMVCESLQDIQKCIPGSAGEYIILNVISGVRVELKSQVIDMS